MAQVLILFAALSTCDPGNVLDAVKAAKQNKIRVSIVGVAAEVHICRVFTQVTCSCILDHSLAVLADGSCSILSTPCPMARFHPFYTMSDGEIVKVLRTVQQMIAVARRKQGARTAWR